MNYHVSLSNSNSLDVWSGWSASGHRNGSAMVASHQGLGNIGQKLKHEGMHRGLLHHHENGIIQDSIVTFPEVTKKKSHRQ
jgi:hypothetical protein